MGRGCLGGVYGSGWIAEWGHPFIRIGTLPLLTRLFYLGGYLFVSLFATLSFSFTNPLYFTYAHV